MTPTPPKNEGTASQSLGAPSAQEVLRRALALLGPNGENWTKGCYARDAEGKPVLNELSSSGASFCMVGSLCRVTGLWDGGDLISDLKERLRACANGQIIPRFNDADKTTFADVRRVFECAIKKAEVA